MGDGMIGHLSKGIVLSKIDALVNHTGTGQPRFDRRAAFLAELKGASNAMEYCQVLRNQAEVTVDQANYLNKKWYTNQGWWPGNPDATFHVVHQGLVNALELATQADLPLDSYWVPAAPASVIEVLICKSAQQVTRIILTPSTTEGPNQERPTRRNMWVIKPRTGAEPSTFDPKADEVIEPILNSPPNSNTVTWRMRDMEATATFDAPDDGGRVVANPAERGRSKSPRRKRPISHPSRRARR